MRTYNFTCGENAPMEDEDYCDCEGRDCTRSVPPTRWEGITPDGKEVIGVNVCNDINDLRLFVGGIEMSPREFRKQYGIPK